jgi:hypothetical protein
MNVVFCVEIRFASDDMSADVKSQHPKTKKYDDNHSNNNTISNTKKKKKL